MSESAIDIERTVYRLKSLGVEDTASTPVEGLTPMTSVCSISVAGATENELSNLPVSCPPDLIKFWQATNSARLFEDQQYGQWGLIIMAPEDAKSLTRRSKADNPALNDEDFIIGEFIGDSDLLLIRCDESSDDFGSVVIVSAIDPRDDWEVVAKSFGEFLVKYADNKGEKYWE